jgi:competence protein ComEC
MIWHRLTKQAVLRGLFFVILLAIAIASSWFYQRSFELNNDRLVFLDVGQGDAIFFESREGQRVLFDGGPDDSAARQLARILPWWDRHLDAVILSHSHSDHLDGLRPVFAAFRVDRLFMADNIVRTGELDRLLIAAGEQGSVVSLLAKEFKLSLRADLFFRLLPDHLSVGENEQSLVALLYDGQAQAALLADISAAREEELASSNPDFKPALIKVSHHGSGLGTSQKILAAWQPKRAIISVGVKNRFGHPDGRVIARLERFGVLISRTDQADSLAYEPFGRDWLALP